MKPGYEPIPQSVRDLRCTAKNDGIEWLNEAADEIMTLRRMLAINYAPHLYGDDGELQDATLPYPIDFARDTVADIDLKMGYRGIKKMVEAGIAKPVGWKLVPVEPTDDMQVAGQEAWMKKRAGRVAFEECEEAQDVYRDMLAAAPEFDWKPHAQGLEK